MNYEFQKPRLKKKRLIHLCVNFCLTRFQCSIGAPMVPLKCLRHAKKARKVSKDDKSKYLWQHCIKNKLLEN